MSAGTSLMTPIIYGSSAASGTLTLQSTSNATKGNILMNPDGGDDFNNFENEENQGLTAISAILKMLVEVWMSY